MKVKLSLKERYESTTKREAKTTVSRSRRRRERGSQTSKVFSSFFRKLMLSLEIKICWASRAPKKEKKNIYPSGEARSWPRLAFLPSVLLLSRKLAILS